MNANDIDLNYILYIKQAKPIKNTKTKFLTFFFKWKQKNKTIQNIIQL